MTLTTAFRRTSQDLPPEQHAPTAPGQYDLYPAFPTGPGALQVGFDALAEAISSQRRVIIDGYGGVLWDHFRDQLRAALETRGVAATWLDVNAALLPEAEINVRVEPFLGGDDPIFGTRFTGTLADFFDADQLGQLAASSDADLTIVYGSGAALVPLDEAFIVYVDVPKNEIQFRSRAGSITNLGVSQPDDAKKMYKRFYFVDWVALSQHKADLLPRIDLMVDEQRPDVPVMMPGDALRDGLERMSRNYFRVRPWFEPGVWGGQWIKEKIPQLPQDVPNYAWSFELIVPENGLMFSDGERLLEVSFDCLMFQASESVLGACAPRFGHEFPVRFDFLDTYDGGNLSVQVHPSPDFIKENFGETYTQDETYYILDCEPGARVYLGFQDDIDPAAFRQALEDSFQRAEPMDVDRYVNSEEAEKHGLYLIPNGTIHCSGINSLVLEISATPYIFTFKMYDWMRLDLDGRPRPLNIDRAMANLKFDRKGDRIRREFIAHPRTITSGDDWQIVHLPTHEQHFYDVHRLEFDTHIDVNTDGSFHVMSLVEGSSVLLETPDGMRQRFNYAETFVVPAAAGRYRLINEGDGRAKVVKAFMK